MFQSPLPTKKVLGKIFLTVLLIIGVIFFVFPLIWMVMTSLKTLPEVITIPVTFFPKDPQWSNYVKVFERIPLGKAYLNSAIIATGAVVGSLFISSLGGFTFGKLRFPGRDILFLVILATLMIPFFLLAIPLFVLMNTLGWTDTYQGLIVPQMFTAFGVFLMRQYMLSIPDDLLDAAKIDGCSTFMIYWRIVLPISKPALGALAIFIFVFSWDQFLWPLIIVQSTEMYTIPLVLRMLQLEAANDYHYMMAGTTLAIIGVLAVFLIAQKHIVKGVALSGLKF